MDCIHSISSGLLNIHTQLEIRSYTRAMGNQPQRTKECHCKNHSYFILFLVPLAARRVESLELQSGFYFRGLYPLLRTQTVERVNSSEDSLSTSTEHTPSTFVPPFASYRFAWAMFGLVGKYTRLCSEQYGDEVEALEENKKCTENHPRTFRRTVDC